MGQWGEFPWQPGLVQKWKQRKSRCWTNSHVQSMAADPAYTAVGKWGMRWCSWTRTTRVPVLLCAEASSAHELVWLGADWLTWGCSSRNFQGSCPWALIACMALAIHPTLQQVANMVQSDSKQLKPWDQAATVPMDSICRSTPPGETWPSPTLCAWEQRICW